jgi:putative component of membrane protein insertase Oxa1/YidC/SpoIIIJ protein YidD
LGLCAESGECCDSNEGLILILRFYKVLFDALILPQKCRHRFARSCTDIGLQLASVLTSVIATFFIMVTTVD